MNQQNGRDRTASCVVRAGLTLLLFFVIFSSGSEAWGQDRRFSIALTSGLYKPSLSTLNRILGNPNQAILQDPNYLLPRNRLLPAEVRNIVVPTITERVNYGLEVQWEATDDFSVVATLSIWQGDAVAHDTITTFIRQDLPPVQAPRSARYDVSLSQIWLGWKYNLYRNPERGRVFVNVGLAGVTLADLTMDTLFKVDTPDQNFAATSSTEARGLAYTTRIGLGGEYFLTEWLSVGFNVNYVIGKITNLEVERHFRQNFANIPVPPTEANQPPGVPVPQEGEEIRYADVVSQNITDTCSPASPQSDTSPFGTCAPGAGNELELELNGLQITGQIRFYF